ncbi:hypothetical protein AYI69_g5463 [Smittium culicis]|uniref:Uncharacterized protein n=1 Tax=Smittium culicis TaxID=133412 RepID=A0A1R1Y5J3_9FUNG|nr:hypothetical protein AYI69_g5463 [Smittium culicis]
MDLSGKPKQLLDSDTKPLMDQEKLDALISNKKPEKGARIHKPFRGRQQLGTQNSTGRNTAQAQTTEAAVPSATVNSSTGSPVGGRLAIFRSAWTKLTNRDWVQNIVEKGFRIPFRKSESKSKDYEESAASLKNNSIGAATVEVTSDTQQEENQSRGPPDSYRRGSISTVQESHRGCQTPKSGLLQQPIFYSKKNRGTQTSPGFEEAELTFGTKELQNGNIDVDMPDDSTRAT